MRDILLRIYLNMLVLSIPVSFMYNVQIFCYFLVHSMSNNLKALCWYDLSNFKIIVVIIITIIIIIVVIKNCNCLLMIPELQ